MRVKRLACALAALFAASAGAQVTNTGTDPQQRASALVAQMTQEEKLRLVFGYFSTDFNGVARPKEGINYTAGFMPSRGVRGFGENTTLDGVIADARAMGPGKPLWVTEYNHATYDDRTRWSPFVMPDTVAARYLLRGLALMFKKGVERIFVYSLIDELDDEESYGLLAHTASFDLEPRPAYHALQRLLASLSDPGSPHEPQSLDYRLLGDLADVETLLLQKRDGTWLLLIWQEVSLWDRASVAEIVPPRRQLTLTLPVPTSVVAYEPSEDAGGKTLASCSRSVSLSVPGHVMLLEIQPVADGCAL